MNSTTTCSYGHPFIAFGYNQSSANGGSNSGLIENPQTVTGNPLPSQAGSNAISSVGGVGFASSTCATVSSGGSSGGSSCGTGTTSPCYIDFSPISLVGIWIVALASFALMVWLLRKHT